MAKQTKTNDNPEMMRKCLLRMAKFNKRMNKEGIEFLVNLPVIENKYKEYCFMSFKKSEIKKHLEPSLVHTLERYNVDRDEALKIHVRTCKGNNNFLLYPNSLSIAAVGWAFGAKTGGQIYTDRPKQQIGYVLGRTPWIEDLGENPERGSELLMASEIYADSDPEWVVANEEVIAKPIKESEQPIIRMIYDLRIIDQDYAWRMKK